MTYSVFIIDNYDHESTSSLGRVYETAEAAIGFCKSIVDEFLATAHKSGMTSAELWQHYAMFGEDPVMSDAGGIVFSGWEYAKLQCQALCEGASD